MKAIGIVRRIDNLGRIVIPKEIRRVLRIREGDPMEICTNQEGEVVLKKYSPMGELNRFAEKYAESVSKSLGCTIVVTDTDQIIAAAGSSKKELMGKWIGSCVEDVLSKKKIKIEQGEKFMESMTAEPVSIDDYHSRVIAPILHQGVSIGSVILMKKNGKCGEIEQKMMEIGAAFLAEQMDY